MSSRLRRRRRSKVWLTDLTNEFSSDCWRISDLPAAELEELVSACKELHYSTLLQTLATPDSLEGPGAIAKTYDQVSKLAADGWTLIEPLIRQDAPPSTLKQRSVRS